MTRRSRLQVYLEVLSVIKSGTDKPTRIMSGANISWKPLQEILASLVSRGLITEIEPEYRDKRTTRTYRITEKGDNVLMYFIRMEQLLVVK